MERQYMKIGKISESVLKRSVLKQIKTKRDEIKNGAGVGGDCAVFALSDSAAAGCAAAACGVFRPSDAARAVVRCANNLAAGGAEPLAVMMTLLLPENVEEAEIRALMEQAEGACSMLNIQIAGGPTEISGAVNRPVVTMTGLGKALSRQAVPQTGSFLNRACPGQDIVISKWIGLEGTALLAESRRESLLSRYPTYFVEEAACFDRYLSIVPEAAVAVKSGVCAMHDASVGGIFAALWELAERAGVGLSIDLKKLPIRQETVEVCEHCGVNPYELLSGGCLLMTSQDGPGLVRALEAAHIPAVMAGKITEGHDRIVYNEDEIRYLDRPKSDEIYRFYGMS